MDWIIEGKGERDVYFQSKEMEDFVGTFADESLIELRDLLLREFPIEAPVPSESYEAGVADERARCLGIVRRHSELTTSYIRKSTCDGIVAEITLDAIPIEPQPAQSEPDPDQVRRALDELDGTCATLAAHLVRDAARAWLRDREQPGTAEVPSKAYQRGYNDGCASKAPSIAQVIEACDADDHAWINLRPEKDGKYLAWIPKRYSATADTPEAALAKLYDEAIAKLKKRRDEADARLKKLGA